MTGPLRELAHKVQAKTMAIALLAFRIGGAQAVELRLIEADAIVDHLQQHVIVAALDRDQDSRCLCVLQGVRHKIAGGAHQFDRLGPDIHVRPAGAQRNPCRARLIPEHRLAIGQHEPRGKGFDTLIRPFADKRVFGQCIGKAALRDPLQIGDRRFETAGGLRVSCGDILQPAVQGQQWLLEIVRGRSDARPQIFGMAPCRVVAITAFLQGLGQLQLLARGADFCFERAVERTLDRKHPRAKGKAAASPAKQAAKSAKKGKRRAEGKTSKPKTERVAVRQPGPSRKKTRRGKGKTANLAARPGLAIPSRLAAAAPTTPPPVPPRAARSPRMKAKATASPAMQAASRARKQARAGSANSSVITRTIRPLGGGAPITPARPPKAKQGKKSRFYFNPFRGWFGGSKGK